MSTVSSKKSTTLATGAKMPPPVKPPKTAAAAPPPPPPPPLPPVQMSHPRVVTTNARKPGLTLVERYRIVHAGVEHHKATRKSYAGSGHGAETAEASEMLLLYQELAFKVANEAAGVKKEG